MIEVLSVITSATVQDLGRWGYQRYGVPVSGVMDEVSARIANYLVGNPDNTPLIEFTAGGISIKFHTSAVFAVTGDATLYLNDTQLEPWESYWAKRGDVLTVRLSKGMYGYIAFSGGIECRKILGSCSTYLRAKFGGLLKPGDKLKLGYSLLTGKAGKRLPEELRPRFDKTVRVILGPNIEHFTPEGMRTFLTSEYTVTPESDRMGYRLEGPRIEHSEKGADIITEPIPRGAIQVPANGKPIIMLADAQTTGGYAKIATVIRVDIPMVVQTRPGEKLRFKAVSVNEAVQELRKRERIMNAIRKALQDEWNLYRIKVGKEEFLIFAGMEED
ncbi:urea amidolyase [Pyrococcus furiosus DSM 3638]|uniref:Urea amidolyase n=3 Tax=Pyrococcus furiosus TaxID=2261 RepID=A0A5C0XNV8_PYRFU|nr:biotin-dependent carboxyltransferase family protein [Pyrococcus furiosus]AAL81398.1 urea amidolyase [Pyrococcus furiosus DSM 3638]AFN04058.1 urea amidolyase [Pyrococcus furiosus COM1]QEK78916.1 urea amidolyase [Pyrococcus furiosus DSM 3638]